MLAREGRRASTPRMSKPAHSLGSLALLMALFSAGCPDTPMSADAFVPPMPDAFAPPDAYAPVRDDAFVPIADDAFVPMGVDAYEPSGGGCGWDLKAGAFQCGSPNRPPDGPDFVCSGDTCTYTEPGAMCFQQTCDYATGQITTCAYSAGACPCEVTEYCGEP
jgi:hypothetical protein